jgi:hypothetical protein
MDVYAADFTGLVQSFKLRRINPNVLLPLPIVLSMCLSQVRLFTGKRLATSKKYRKEQQDSFSIITQTEHLAVLLKW